MRKLTLFLVLALTLSLQTANADIFGGDVAVLSQILIQAIEQLNALKNILNTSTDTLGLLQHINRGINDSLNLLRTIDPNLDPGLYREWDTVSMASSQLESIYGGPVNSPDVKIEKDADQSVAEAITFNNNFFKWSRALDVVGEQIKQSSHDVSPGGAQKLTAQALGLVIQVLNQNLRAQATSLKLQAQSLAIENRKEKQSAQEILGTAGALSAAMKSENPAYAIPRF
ncbi:MAG: hypothetical protein HY537_00435 [Deltaproteobacteria bacterium]|nr:hypothetical protein [Deltaproteobacteria bacterium]